MFKCNTCLYKSNKKCNIRKHIINIHYREPEYNEVIKNELINCNEKSKNILRCNKCLKDFKSLWGYKKHEKICKNIVNSLECPYCHNIYSCRQTKSKHIYNCKIKDAEEQIDKINSEQINTSNIINNTNTNNKIIYQINNYRISTNEYNEYNKKYNIEDNIENINDFGMENISYISEEQMYNYASKHEFNDFIIEKHFNQEHPENHNIIGNCKKSYKVLKNKKWYPLHKDAVYSIIYNNTRSQLTTFACKYILPNLNELDAEEYMCIMEKYDKKFKKNIYKTIEIQYKEFIKAKHQDKILSLL